MTEITSSSNNIVKHIKKLSSSSFRRKNGEFLLEGIRLINDAINLGCFIKYFVVSKSYNGSLFDNIKTYQMPDNLFNTLKTTINSQGIIAVSQMMDHSFLEKKLENQNTIVYLDNISDPGNMGTIIRTCNGAGVKLLILSHDCTDIYNPKTVRATMAGMFNVNIVIPKKEDNVFNVLKEHGFTIAAASLDTEFSYYDADFSKKTAIIIGNEANGIRDEVLNFADLKIKIPVLGGAESLNAAVSCGVILYEALRQNLTKTKTS